LGGWSGFAWLRIGTGGGLLWMRWWTPGFWRHAVSYFQHSPLILHKPQISMHWNASQWMMICMFILSVPCL
jgi:hypothetical protein